VNEDIESVLDKCIDEMDSGASLEACVARYPALAARLEPLLRLALEIRSLGQEPAPTPLNLQAGRQRVLREAARLRIDQQQKAGTRQMPWWLNLQALLRKSAAAVALASVLLVTILGAGTVAISANSLPGDALYPVKRISEEVQLFLTIDEERKAQLVERLDARRRQEALAISSSQRVAELSFRGQVESVEDGRWSIGGVPVSVSDETLVGAGVQVGTFVRVQVRSLSDGTLLALSISVEPLAKPLQLTASPTPEETAAPTQLATPSPTATTSPTTRAPIQPASATATPSRTPTVTVTGTPSPTPTVTSTPVPPRQVKIRFTGRIEEMGADRWTIDGRVVKVDASTNIDESQASAAIGAMARVVAVRDEDGGLVAVTIAIEPTPQTPEEPFEFRGLIESFDSNLWMVGGYSLTITPDTVVEGSPRRGLLAQVKAVRLGDGSLVAVQIVVVPPTEEVQFEGVIQSLAAGEWVVEGVIVRLDTETVVEGKPEVGGTAEVEGLLLADGAVLARTIFVQPAPTATPTAPPALPTDTPTSTLATTQTVTLTETALLSIQR
jgi:hypothetical protein